MKIRVSLTFQSSDSTTHVRDATLTADVTATVGEVARTLVRAGAGDPRLLDIAQRGTAPLTIVARHPDRPPLALDRGDALGHSGLLAGSTVEPILERDAVHYQRVRMSTAHIRVLSGPQKDVTFSAVRGETTIGRDRVNRVQLHDSSVSRRHAVVKSDGSWLVLEDAGSANGILLVSDRGASEETRVSSVSITRPCEVRLGTVHLRITPDAPPSPDQPYETTIRHLQSPRVDPLFAPEPLELPTPPESAANTRFPLIAMVAPIVMGSVLYAVTGSMMSLVFVALSPLIMLGTWLDARLTRKRTLARETADFETGLAQARAELAAERTREHELRCAESPDSTELLAVPSSRDRLLWTRRPEHRAFLELNLGRGTLPSRKEITLPSRGKIAAAHWQALTEVSTEFRTCADVPVIERLDRCGALGISGDPFWAAAEARSLLIQLLTLHSPADLVLTAFTDTEQSAAGWSWLKWVPHVDSVFSPISTSHLVNDTPGSASLLTSLEGLILTRREGASGEIRSRMTTDGADLSERGAAVTSAPATPIVVVLVLCTSLVERARLVGLAEDGADVGVHIIWVDDQLDFIPAACRTTVEMSEAGGRVHFVRQGRVVELGRMDLPGVEPTAAFGRALAPIVDAGARVLDESDFPGSVALGTLLARDVVGNPDAVRMNWEANDSLVRSWVPGIEREAGDLTAVVGLGSAGSVALDLRTHGPHALVGGTTGSGKSEFLQSWILSLAASYAPDRVTFLLVDYKGGAAFADCTSLPHTVGLVTDLNTHLVRRALTSLRAELRYREELLAEKGAKDLVALERSGDPSTPPNLIIVIDEFAALVGEIPEFVDGVIDVAQRGRSLGLHLVMATQRPAGVIRDNLRANTNLRIGLRMSDPADSTDVLGVADAAAFAPETPGRAAVKVGAGRLTHFQAGYLGGRSESEHQEVLEIHSLDFGEHAAWSLHPEQRIARKRTTKGPRDIEALVRNIRSAAEGLALSVPRRPWVDQLPTVLPLSELVTPGETPRVPGGDGAGSGSSTTRGSGIPRLSGVPRIPGAKVPMGRSLATGQLAPTREPGKPEQTDPAGLGLALGMVDEPHLQRRSTYRVALEDVGSIALFGAAGTGKTTALITLAIALIDRDPRASVYGLDGAGGRLSTLESLPNAGDIIPIAERDRVVRLLSMLQRIVAERQGSGERAPVLLLLDGFGAFRDTYEFLGGGTHPFEDLIEIARDGRNVGVHVAIASERAVDFPATLGASIPERLSFRLASDNDYQALGLPSGVLEDSEPGRALRMGTEEDIQWAVPGAGATPEDTEQAVVERAERLMAAGVRRVAGIPEVPKRIERGAIEARPGEFPFAIDTVHLAAVSPADSGLMLVTGPAGSGRTTAIRSLWQAARERARAGGGDVDTIVISSRRSPLRGGAIIADFADNAAERQRVIAQLTTALGGPAPVQAGALTVGLIGTPQPIAEAPALIGPPSGGADLSAAPTPEAAAPVAPPEFPRPGCRGVVIIEDIGGFDGTGNEQALATLLKLLRRSELMVLVEGENATMGTVWELVSPLRGARWALALQPDANDAPTVFTTPFTHAKRADYPPGRGFLATGGMLTGVQIGFA
ncbi:FtsK/SpoIIIE domain-containing protein [Mycetocola tolaasinivorans]|nr:FtsK/SpoIIIE domain-containing protein [Mycetocola tolaasinivorans]